MLHLTLDAINLIDVIARTGSFSAAAEVLRKVPSTISYTISKLEDQMGVKLFERHGPRVTLTPLGRSLLEEGRSLLFAANDLELRLQRMAKGIEPELTIVLASSLSISAYAKDLDDFNNSPFGTQLYLRHEVSASAWDALIQHSANLVIAPGDPPTGSIYKTHKLGSVDFVFCVAPTHPLAQEPEPISDEKLREYTAIALLDVERRQPLRTSGVRFGQRQIVVELLADKVRLQKLGVGHGFLPRAIADRAVARGELVIRTVQEPRNNVTFSLGWRHGEEGPALSWWRERLKRPINDFSFVDGL